MFKLVFYCLNKMIAKELADNILLVVPLIIIYINPKLTDNILLIVPLIII